MARFHNFLLDNTPATILEYPCFVPFSVNPTNQEGAVMQTADGILTAVDNDIHLGWTRIRSWVESVFTRERTRDIVLLSFALTLYAVLLFSFYNAVQNSTVDTSHVLTRPFAEAPYLNILG
jgi:hypothetical protein